MLQLVKDAHQTGCFRGRALPDRAVQSFVTVSAALLHAMDLHRRLLKGEGSTLACLALGLYIYSKLVKVLTGRHWQPQRMGHCMSYSVRYSIVHLQIF